MMYVCVQRRVYMYVYMHVNMTAWHYSMDWASGTEVRLCGRACQCHGVSACASVTARRGNLKVYAFVLHVCVPLRLCH